MADKPSKIPVRVTDNAKVAFSKVKKTKSFIEGNEAMLEILKREKVECTEKIKAVVAKSII